MGANTMTVTDTTFDSDVLGADGPVLVDFWAEWCGPCHAVAPVLDKIAAEREGRLKLVKLNIDENQQTAVKFNVMSIPTLMLFKHGEVAKTVIGAYPKRKIEEELEPALA
jgi:thioredoxin 1